MLLVWDSFLFLYNGIVKASGFYYWRKLLLVWDSVFYAG
jgi:hypothetical protein